MTANHSTTRMGLNEDFALQLVRGNIYKHSTINKFGRNTSVAAAGTEEIWDGSAAYSYPATALMTRISQTTDQEALRGATVEVQGLDANWALSIQNATLNASDTTTAVVLTTPLIRVFRMRILSSVVADSTVRVHNTAENQDYAIISVGKQQTQMAIYTVPADHSAYVTNYYAFHNPTVGQTFTSNPIELWARDNANGYAPQLKHIVGLPEDGQFQYNFNPYYAFGEKTDIYLTSSPVAAAADVSAGFDLILVRD